MAIVLRFEDRLDGVEKFSPWKERIVLLLDEARLRDIVNNTHKKSQHCSYRCNSFGRVQEEEREGQEDYS